MPELNRELADVATSMIALMRSERHWRWTEEEIFHRACAAVLRYIEDKGDLDFKNSRENLAAIYALVKQCMAES